MVEGLIWKKPQRTLCNHIHFTLNTEKTLITVLETADIICSRDSKTCNEITCSTYYQFHWTISLENFFGKILWARRWSPSWEETRGRMEEERGFFQFHTSHNKTTFLGQMELGRGSSYPCAFIYFTLNKKPKICSMFLKQLILYVQEFRKMAKKKPYLYHSFVLSNFNNVSGQFLWAKR